MSRKTTRRAAPMRAKASRKSARPKPKAKAAPSSREKVRAYRTRMRARGFRLVQMWLPDTSTPEFAAEARRQCLIANSSPFAARIRPLSIRSPGGTPRKPPSSA